MRIVSVIVTAVILMAGAAYADYVNGFEIKTIDGEVVFLDTMKGEMTVRWLEDDIAVIYDELSIKVDKSARIVKGGDDITIDDLNSGDMVVCRYYVPDIGVPKAVSISVTV